MITFKGRRKHTKGGIGAANNYYLNHRLIDHYFHNYSINCLLYKLSKDSENILNEVFKLLPYSSQ